MCAATTRPTANKTVWCPAAGSSAAGTQVDIDNGAARSPAVVVGGPVQTCIAAAMGLHLEVDGAG